MKQITNLTVLFVIILMMITACQKDDFKPTQAQTTIEVKNNSATTTYGGNQKIHKNSINTQTILGALRTNPYTVTQMTQAWNTLYPEDQVSSLPLTHTYLKFTPQSLEEVKVLTETDYFFYDYPLEYELVQLGDYYQDPTLDEADIPYLYVVITADDPIPNVPHTVLAELFLPPYETALTAKAFEMTGNEYDYAAVNDALLDDMEGGTPESGCSPECPNYPDCTFDPNIGCGDTGNGSGGSSGTGTNNTPPCQPGSPTFPDCLMITGTVGSTTLSAITTNECGCTVYDNAWKPGGCIRVQDTQLPANSTVVVNPDNGATQNLHMDGVQNIEVIYKDGWFSQFSTFTDQNGCFKIDRRLFGDLQRHIVFKSDEMTIRGLRQWRVWNYAFAVRVRDQIPANTPLNQTEINFLNNTIINDIETLYYVAATTNNSLYEYNQMAQQEGIQPPPMDLDVLATTWGTTGGAPMLDEIFQAPNSALTLIPAAYIGVMLSPPLTPGGIATATIASTLTHWAPDLFIGYNNGPNAFNSDQAKNTLYHELGHASHYGQVGANYWSANIMHVLNVTATNFVIQANNVTATIQGNPFNLNIVPELPASYGDGNQNGSDRCAVIEMWGFHIGPTMAEMRYGLNHSNDNDPLNPPTLRASHINMLEGLTGFICGGNPCDQFIAGFIPRGLFHDLVDDNAVDYPFPSIFEDVAITDNIDGFENSEFFQVLTPTTQSPQDVRQELINNGLPPGNNVNDFINLFQDYNIF